LSKSSLEINAASLPCKISDKKFTSTNSSNYLVVDLVVVFNFINSNRFIAICLFEKHQLNLVSGKKNIFV